MHLQGGLARSVTLPEPVTPHGETCGGSEIWAVSTSHRTKAGWRRGSRTPSDWSNGPSAVRSNCGALRRAHAPHTQRTSRQASDAQPRNPDAQPSGDLRAATCAVRGEHTPWPASGPGVACLCGGGTRVEVYVPCRSSGAPVTGTSGLMGATSSVGSGRAPLDVPPAWGTPSRASPCLQAGACARRRRQTTNHGIVDRRGWTSHAKGCAAKSSKQSSTLPAVGSPEAWGRRIARQARRQRWLKTVV